MTPDPKPVTDKDPKYLAWIRKQPCTKGCGRTAQAHHQGGQGRKGTSGKVSDYFALPLCHVCHDEHNNTGTKTFWWRYDVKQLIIDHLIKYIKERR